MREIIMLLKHTGGLFIKLIKNKFKQQILQSTLSSQQLTFTHDWLTTSFIKKMNLINDK